MTGFLPPIYNASGAYTSERNLHEMKAILITLAVVVYAAIYMGLVIMLMS
jgi:uncharacterized membrane protein YdfJ with MMPL/SSD domain